MKKLIYILAALGLMSIAACEKDGPSATENPISNIEMPATAEIGASVTVRGEGFDAASAKLFLADSKGKETVVESPKFTSMGVSFIVPKSLTAGVHTLICEQSGRFELGKITLKTPGLPVTGLKCPAGAGAGQEITIEGMGFPENCTVAAIDSKGTRFEFTVKDRTTGLKVAIPSEIAAGEYRLVLTDGNLEWNISDKFTIFKKKSIRKIINSQSIPEMMEINTSWEVKKNGSEVNGLLFSQSYVFAGSDPMEGSNNYAVSKQGETYSFTPEAEDESNMPFTITVKDGKVESNTIKRSEKKTDEYKWSYTTEGYVEKLYKNTPDKPSMSFTYKDGAMIAYEGSSGASFSHEGAKIMDNPFSPDATKVIMFFDGNLENFQIVANILEWDGNNTKSYPVAIEVITDESGNTTLYPISYKFDEDGYVTEMSWVDEGQGMNISTKFEYFE